MLRLKIFTTTACGGDINQLEDAINRWLDTFQPAIRQMTQSSSEEYVVVTFLYDSGQRDVQTRITSAVVPEAFERGLNGSELDLADDEPTLLPDAELPY